jgi:hypothetical protein
VDLGHGPARGDGVAWVNGADQGALETQEGDVVDDRRTQPLGDAEDQGARAIRLEKGVFFRTHSSSVCSGLKSPDSRFMRCPDPATATTKCSGSR